MRTLFDPPPPALDLPTRARVLAFDRQNPDIYTRLRDMAIRAQAAGRRIGIKCLWESLRYDLSITTTGDEWKLNNNLHAGYARLLMEREPRLFGYFETRSRRRDAS